MLGNKVWKYFGFRLLGGRTYDSTGYAANPVSAVTDKTGSIYLLKVRQYLSQSSSYNYINCDIVRAYSKQIIAPGTATRRDI